MKPRSDQAARWWSPAPVQEQPAISARRAYGEVLFVFAVFFLAGVVGAALLLADRYKNILDNTSWSVFIPESIDALAQSALAVAVVILLATRRHISARALGLDVPRQADGRFAASRTLRILAWAMFALVLGGAINVFLQTGHLPTNQPSAPELLFGVVRSFNAGVVEELVVLAFVVVTLRQARRPLWEITVVALVLRGSYHIYYGPGVVGVLVWAALFYWIYLRTQSLLPLILCHFGWDAVAFLSQRWAAVGLIAVVVVIGIWIAAPITWLAERADRDRQRAFRRSGRAGWIPPGWHPDPSGLPRWRWWDGRAWTEHVSRH